VAVANAPATDLEVMVMPNPGEPFGELGDDAAGATAVVARIAASGNSQAECYHTRNISYIDFSAAG
jgi:hypothetical protein